MEAYKEYVMILDYYSRTVFGAKASPDHPVNKAVVSILNGFQKRGFEIRTKSNPDGQNDLGFMFGWCTSHKPSSRLSISNHQKSINSPLLCIDDGVFSTWQRRSHGAIVAMRLGVGNPIGTGEYFNKNKSDDRWQMLKEEFNIQEQPWKTDGPILVCMNANTGWGYDETTPFHVWASRQIKKIKKHTDRKIILRPHPRGSAQIEEIAKKYGCGIDYTDDMQASIANAYACIIHSSSASIESIVLGTHVFIGSEEAMGYEVCNTDLSKIESPRLFDRTKWFNDISYTTWLPSEMDNIAVDHIIEGLNI